MKEKKKVLRCPECGKKVTSLDEKCPRCGYDPKEEKFHYYDPIPRYTKEEYKVRYNTAIICALVIGLLSLILFFTLVIGYNDGSPETITGIVVSSIGIIISILAVIYGINGKKKRERNMK